MQVLQAGRFKLLLLEVEAELISAAAAQQGFDARIQDSERAINVDLTVTDKSVPLLLFDAADPANLGWFSRCQFYVDGRTGAVLQTPISIANKRDRSGRTLSNSLRLRISRELPATFRLPGKTPLTEQVFYGMFNNFLQALTKTGVAVCGGTTITPLAGRTEAPGSRN
jgi:hypothetical protein